MDEWLTDCLRLSNDVSVFSIIEVSVGCMTGSGVTARNRDATAPATACTTRSAGQR
jgi:hypothetical protein